MCATLTRCMNIVICYAFHIMGLDAHFDGIKHQLEREFAVELDSVAWLFAGGRHDGMDTALLGKVLETLKAILQTIPRDPVIVRPAHVEAY